MKKPSITARTIAMHRAIHLLSDPKPTVIEDPMAEALAGIARNKRLGLSDPCYHDLMWKQTRALTLARSRYTEDLLASYPASEPCQYLLLGAGLDSSAFRLTSKQRASTQVFEVDQPSMQQWKQERLATLGFNIPDHLHFIAVDFETDNLTEKLAQSSFQRQLPTLVSFLGVSYYLTEKSLTETLSMLLDSIDGNCRIVFDFVTRPLPSVTAAEQLWFQHYETIVEQSGEPWIGVYPPSVICELMSDAGFDQVRHLDATQINHMYFNQRSDELHFPASMSLIDASRNNV